MATFDYEAMTADGRLMKGAIEAGSNEEARILLEQMHLTVGSITKSRPPRPRTRFGRNEFLLFNRQLASIAKAGIPLERSLRVLADDAGSGRMREMIIAIAEELEAGADIREAFEKRHGRFPALYGQIIEAGVRSGRLPEMLTSLNRHAEMALQTRRILVEAFTYPLIVLAFAAWILTVMLVSIVPRFAVQFEDMGFSRIPPATEALMAVSRNIVPIWIGIGAAIASVVVLKFVLGASPGGRRFKETILISTPVLGRLYRDLILSRTADAMALLVGAGTDMPGCLRLGAAASGSELMRAECEMLARHVEAGGRILDARDSCRVLPGLFLYSIETGHQRNELADSLYGLSETHAGQARANQARMQAMLLPVLLITIGVFIGTAVSAMFLPMIDMLDALQM